LERPSKASRARTDVELVGALQETKETLAPGGYIGGSQDLDDVHSFVLRLHLDPSPGGRGDPRPKFTLEHVNLQTSRHLRNLEEVVKELARQIELILQRAKGEAD